MCRRVDRRRRMRMIVWTRRTYELTMSTQPMTIPRILVPEESGAAKAALIGPNRGVGLRLLREWQPLLIVTTASGGRTRIVIIIVTTADQDPEGE